MQEIKIPEYARAVLDTAEAYGEEIYIVGGCVRDAILGGLPSDYDMAISCKPQRTVEIYREAGFRTIETGLKHGTVTVLSEGKPIEITTFRVDGEYNDARHPADVRFTARLSDDLSRRDFTVNAMAYNPRTGIIDLFGGKNDVEAGVIRAVGEAEKRFSEDALRIMRAFRFSAKLGFSIEEETLRGAIKCREGLSRISKERISAELCGLLTAKEPREALSVMQKSGILKIITDGIWAEQLDGNDVFGMLSKIDTSICARLGLMLTAISENGAKKLLRTLKTSNKLRRDAMCVRVGALRKTETRLDAARLVFDIGRENAVIAVKASVLLGISEAYAAKLVEESLMIPTSVGELDIGGKEMQEIGFFGREIGDTLTKLLQEVVDGQLENKKDMLFERARRIFEENKGKDV